MKNQRTQKQIEASRRNGQLSTGPKTETGRAVSRMNALKHGIFSREVLVQILHRHESSHEFESLHRRFREELNPVGPVEEMLVDLVVTMHWRMRRVLRAESGEIALSVDRARAESAASENPQSLAWKWALAPDRMSAMEGSAIGAASIELYLGEARASVEKEGELTDAGMLALDRSLGGKANRLTLELEKFRLDLSKRLAGLEPAVFKETRKQETLAWLDEKLKAFGHQSARLQELEQRQAEARTNAAVLPAMPVLEKILLYEMRLDRRLHRAMSQLERLQRMRRGETVPPPLKLELAEDS